MTSEVIATENIERDTEVAHSCKRLLPFEAGSRPAPILTQSPDAPIGMPKNDRQRILSNWNFNCTCSLCTAPKDKTWGSEMRRMRLMEIYDAIRDQSKPMSPQEIEAIETEMMIIIRHEDLQMQLSEYYMVLADAYARALVFDKARQYAAMAEELWIRYGTEEHENVAGMRALWEDIDQRELAERMGPKEKWFYEVVDEIDDDDGPTATA